ncbi:iron-sulfur cluster assembly scaffold protein [bacterium]|nr:iron-sulfur cluster assembly scaffold protein [bacterium]
MFGDLYHNRVLELAGDIPHLDPLQDAHGRSLKVSKICGSTVEVAVRLDEGGRISAISVDPKACALGQASTSILARQAIGKSLSDIIAARDGLKAMLKDGAEPPTGDFWELRHLAPVRDYPPRHQSTLLAFEAATAAIEMALEARAPAG